MPSADALLINSKAQRLAQRAWCTAVCYLHSYWDLTMSVWLPERVRSSNGTLLCVVPWQNCIMFIRFQKTRWDFKIHIKDMTPGNNLHDCLSPFLHSFFPLLYLPFSVLLFSFSHSLSRLSILSFISSLFSVFLFPFLSYFFSMLSFF